jgi:hypothetical protein
MKFSKSRGRSECEYCLGSQISREDVKESQSNAEPLKKRSESHSYL